MTESVPTGASRWKALALLCTAFFMVILDSAIVVVALPSIDADLDFATGDLQWVLSAYLLSFGGLLLLGGRAADLLGRRRMFIVGTGLFALASLGAGLSGSSEALLTARAVQGVAAAIMTPTAVFVAIEARSAAPLAPLHVFRSRSLVGGNLVLFTLGTTGFGVPFVLTQYAQEVLGWSPIHFGLASLVMPLAAVIGTSTAQALVSRTGVRPVAVAGIALTGLGGLLLTQVSVGGSYLGDLFF